MGVRTEATVPVSGRLQIESSLGFGVLSLGLRMVDMEEDDESAAKPLTLLAGTAGTFSSGLRFDLSERFALRASYLLGVTRITAWEPLHVASDNLVVTMACGW